MTASKVLMTLILDKDVVVSDVPCASATLIAQYTEGYFALAITAEGTCVLGFEGEQHAPVRLRDLLDLLMKARGGGPKQLGLASPAYCAH